MNEGLKESDVVQKHQLVVEQRNQPVAENVRRIDTDIHVLCKNDSLVEVQDACHLASSCGVTERDEKRKQVSNRSPVYFVRVSAG